MGDIDFYVIFVAENSNKFQKTRFWKEKSVDDMVTLEGLPFNSSMISFHIWLLKKSGHTNGYEKANQHVPFHVHVIYIN